MIVTTTPGIEGRRITAYHGVVTGETIIGANIFRDIVGGRSGAYENALASARETALSEMQDRARQLGGNAVVGVDLDYEVINNMLMVSASGTSVTVEQEPK
jgi:uncharacterized protein YbjQ (UPF0145 family)